MAVELRVFSWDRMIEAVQAVRDRALRATYPLPTADVTESIVADDYAIVTLEALVRLQQLIDDPEG